MRIFGYSDEQLKVYLPEKSTSADLTILQIARSTMPKKKVMLPVLTTKGVKSALM